MTIHTSICLLAVAGVIPPNLNPWKNPRHPLPQYVIDRKSNMGPQNKEEMYRDLAAFPKPASELVWPKENPWVKTPRGSVVVHAKSFGWNPDDGTEALEKALQSDAKTVIIDKMEKPWRVKTLHPTGDKTIVLERGVHIIGTKESQLSGSMGDMFALNRVKNIFLVGRGDNYVGRYTETEETGRNVNGKYGGIGVGIGNSENIAIKNITFANNGMDGACLGGDYRPAHNIWFEDCVFDRNTRQGVSIISADGVYFKNCTFSRTCGLAPKCGLDIEPWLPQNNASANIYIFGCTFEDNRGGHLQFSTASIWPVTVYVKDCLFKAHGLAAIGITQRVLYPEYQTDAPSDVIFENCRIEARRGVVPVRFDEGNFFHTTFRGGEIVEVGGGSKPSAAPFFFRLNREFRMEKDNSPVPRPVPEGSLVFDNVKITGYNSTDKLMWLEDTAKLCTVTSLYGTVIHNGKKTDMAQFRYPGPQEDLKDKGKGKGKSKDRSRDRSRDRKGRNRK